MSKRGVRITLLCEDRQHEAFVRRALYEKGYTNHDLRVDDYLHASGDAKNRVLGRYPILVGVHRSAATYRNLGLLTVIDADEDSVGKVYSALDGKLEDNGIQKRGRNERIAILVPKRNIETWINCLDGNIVDETQRYPKLQNERDCQSAAKKFIRKCCKEPPEDKDWIPSLKLGCQEIKKIV